LAQQELVPVTALVARSSGGYAVEVVRPEHPPRWVPVPALSTAGAFTADSFALSDFAHIHVSSTGAFTEDGYLKIKAFQLGASTVSTPGLNSTAGATPYPK